MHAYNVIFAKLTPILWSQYYLHQEEYLFHFYSNIYPLEIFQLLPNQMSQVLWSPWNFELIQQELYNKLKVLVSSNNSMCYQIISAHNICS